MKVACISGIGSVWGRYDPKILEREDKTVGGGEAAMLLTSFGLAARGHDVTLFYPGDAAGYRGVHFRPLGDHLLEIAKGRYPVVVSWSDADAIRACPPGVRAVFSQQLNDMPQDGFFWKRVDAIVSPSFTHASYLGEWMPPVAANPKWVIMGGGPGGADPAIFASAKPLCERAPIVSYWSSPDRGLHHLLSVWPEIRAAVPEAELRIFYHLDRYIADVRRRWEYQELAWRADLLEKLTHPLPPGVKVMGAVAQPVLARAACETKVLAYPFDPVMFTEGLATALLIAHAAGCYVVARPDDALEEIYGESIEWVAAPVCDHTFREQFAEAVIAGLRAEEFPHAAAAADVLKRQTWDAATEALEGALQ